MNAVMLHYNGMLGIYMEEDEITNLLVPAMEDDLVVVTWMDNIYQEYDDDDDSLSDELN
jgi:hypothetical protein